MGFTFARKAALVMGIALFTAVLVTPGSAIFSSIVAGALIGWGVAPLLWKALKLDDKDKEI